MNVTEIKYWPRTPNAEKLPKDMTLPDGLTSLDAITTEITARAGETPMSFHVDHIQTLKL